MRLFRSGLKRDLVRRVGATALAVLGMGFLVAPTQAVAIETPCRDLMMPVSFAGTQQTMYGRLCTPPGARTVQILIPGSTYTNVYWDVSYTPEIRSYSRAMNKSGYATLAVDRISSGRSSRPLSALVTTTTQASAIHQVVQAMRSGAHGARFDKVVTVGHSLGSAIAMVEAGTYHDVDGVVVTGLAHRLNVLEAIPIFASLIPAAIDPVLSSRGLDPGYLTTRPGTRYASFHHRGQYLAPVVDLDESTKDVVAVGEVVDAALLGIVLPYTRLIDAPVFLVMADGDHGFCGLLAVDCSSAEAVKRSEALYYSPAAELKTFLLRGYGHSFNYAPNAPLYHQAVVQWADGAVGR